MTSKGYTDQVLVSDALGLHTGEVPLDSLDTWIEAAENWIDKRAGRAWGITSVTNEQVLYDGCSRVAGPVYPVNMIRWTPNNAWADPVIYLKTFPVAAVSAVRARYQSLGATIYTLPVSDYEVMDASKGYLLVSTNWIGYRLGIDYTVTVPAPAAIKLAATQLVAAWVQTALYATDKKALTGIKSYSIGQDLSVTFQDASKASATVLAVPESVAALVDGYRVKSFVV